jgi:hypothetical protein
MSECKLPGRTKQSLLISAIDRAGSSAEVTTFGASSVSATICRVETRVEGAVGSGVTAGGSGGKARTGAGAARRSDATVVGRGGAGALSTLGRGP